MKIALLWFGLEGRSTLKFLMNSWVSLADITIFDEKSDIETPEWVHTVLWENCYDSLVWYDQIWRSPGITSSILWSKLTELLDLDEILSVCTSQTQYFFDTYTGTTIWVTGTKGKSTIATAISLVLRDAWMSVILGWNVWVPIFDIIDFETPPEVVVYEMSSFMLESLNDFKLDIWVFNTLYSTHTKEHGGYMPYVQAKAKILSASKTLYIWSQAEKKLLDNWLLDDKKYTVYGATWKYRVEETKFMIDSTPVASSDNMLLQWIHNAQNMCVVLWVNDYFGNNIESFTQLINTFGWLEHRLEQLGMYKDIYWINDAIATTPQATMAALDAFGDEVETLLYGWIEGEYDHAWVIERIISYWVKNLVLFPDSGHYIKEWLDQNLNILETRSMKEAVSFAKQHTSSWKIALLSCGSPSFSCWSGFVEKGNLFKKYVIANT